MGQRSWTGGVGRAWWGRGDLLLLLGLGLRLGLGLLLLLCDRCGCCATGAAPEQVGAGGCVFMPGGTA